MAMFGFQPPVDPTGALSSQYGGGAGAASGPYDLAAAPQQMVPPQATPAAPNPALAGYPDFSKMGLGKRILGGLFDGLSQWGGMQPQFLPAMQKQRDLQLEFAKMGMQQQAEFQRQLAMKLFELQNPTPTSDMINFKNYQSMQPDQQRAYDAFHPVTSMGPYGVQVISHQDISNALNPNAQAGGTLPVVTDAQSYAAIPNGAQFRTPSGEIRVKGGGASNGTGGFRGP